MPALYDIPSLPDSLLKKKYVRTPDAYYDPRTIENFMKEALRDTGPDAPLFEQDLPRQRINPLSQSILSMQEHGSRYSHTPYHPELFLGDLTKDDRMTTTDPLVSKMRDQHHFRHKRYIEGKMQTSQSALVEGTVGEKRMIRQIKQGFNNTATRLSGLFGDSTNGMSVRANPNPGSSIHQVGTALSEKHKVGDTKILPHYSTDIVNKLSNTIGINWQVQPDNKYGVSSVSNLYRAKQDVDRAANAVFRLGQQDTSFSTEKSQFKNAAAVQTLEKMKAAKKNTPSVVMTNESKLMSWSKKVMHPPTIQTQVGVSKGTQSVKDQFVSKGTTYKYHRNTKLPETFIEPLKGKSVKTVVAKLNMPQRDRMAIAYQIKRERLTPHHAETLSKSKGFNLKNFKGMLTKRAEQFDQRKIKNHFITSRATLRAPNKDIDHFKGKMTKAKFGDIREYTTTNTTGTNKLPSVKNVNDFEFDTDPTMDNNYLTRSGVAQGRMTKLSAKQEYDNAVSPLNDTIVPFRTKYST